MARRKGISKSKTSAKKLTTETSQTIINENSKVKDDPGGNVCITPAMEIVQKRIIELNNQLQQQQQQTSKIITTAQQTSSGGSSLSSTITTTNPVQTTVPTNSNDLKYLHKKFKRFENQTTKLNDNNNLLQIISTPVINVTTNTSTIHTATTTTTTNNDYYKNNNLLNGINNNNNNNHNNNNNNLEKTTTIINQRLLDGNDGSLEQLSLNKLTITNTTTATTTTPTTITTLINGIENQNNNNKLINNILINNNYYNINNLSANNLSNNNNNSVNFTNINNNSSNNQQIITTTTSTTNTATVQHQQQQQQQHHQSQQQQQQQENHFNINHHLLNQSNKSASLNYIISNNNNNSNNSNNINNIYNNNSFVTTTNTATTTVSSLSSSSLASTTFFNPGLLVASQQQQQQSQQHLQNGYELTTTSTVNKQQQPPQQIPSTISSSSTSSSSSSGQPDNNNINNLIIGRHVCPYCQLNCSKPSVLQKHIRAHTNERPYPCVPCGCAFKTKSNLYKHQRSRTHILRTEGIEPPDDDISLGSDQDQDHEMNSNSTGLDILSRTASPMDDRICSSPSQPPIEKPYKPKFHLAGIYTKDDIRSQTTTATTGSGVIGLSINVTVATAAASISTITQSSSSSSCGIGGKKILGGGGHSSSPKHLDFEQHISKLISENAAIVEGGKPPVQKKSMKITGLSRSLVTESSSSKLALALLKREETLNINNNNNSGNNNNNNVAGCSTKIMRSQSIQLQQPILNNFSQPLNLSKITSAAIAAASATGIITNDNIQENSRKRCYSEGFSGQDVANHPQNPERSIIKDLLLNSKGFGAVSSNETDETLFTCPFCKISFRNAENLKYHTICYCQGSQANSPQSEPISPVASPSSHLYFRSNSVHLQYQDTVNSPNSLAKLASTSLRQQPYHTSRGLPSLAKLARNKIKLPRPKPENIIINPIQSQPIIDVQTLVQLNKSIDFIQTPLPSPGPLLGKTRLVDTYNHNDRIPNDVTITFVTNNNNNNSSSSSCSNNNNINNETNGPNNNNNGCNTNNNNNNNLSSIYDNNNEKYGKRPYITNSMQHQFALPIIEEISPRRINLQMFGGDCKILDNKKNDFIMSYNSGGSVKSLSPMSQSDSEPSPILVRSGLLSGGTAIQLPQNQQQQKTPQTPKLIVTNAPTLNATIITTSIPSTTLTHFQFPPINTISGYNPLTLPPIQITSTSGQATTILHGGKMIPFVPGMPGPNTLIPKSDNSNKRIVISPNNNRNKNVPSPLSLQQQTMLSLSTPLQLQPQTIYSPSIPNNFLPAGTLPRISPTPPTTPSHQRNSDDHLFMMKKQNKNGIKGLNIWSPAKQELKKTFNYTRIADNLSPRKIDFLQQQQQQTINNKNFLKSPETEVRHFNYENLISKSQILIKPPENKSQMSPLHVDTTSMPVPSINIYEKKGISPREQQMDTTPIITSVKSSKFLRPTSLPLKPGTFAQKMHHGITPTQNTLPLISPETPRPSKNCIQLYLNGHAYTYLGLKCSTKMTYCTLNRAQPVYITVQQNLSMYSEWRIQGDYNPHPLGISPSEVISLYDSRQRPMKYSIAKMKTNTNLIHSQSIIMTPYENSKLQQYNNNNSDHHNIQPIELNQMITTTSSSSTANLPLSSPLSSSNVTIAPVPGGYESNEDYTYVRGRGRGRYVCSECGIRCKKPSMLKKHIRTHTDVRPYTCKICSFSFKTKGNLTKHMKSKTHYKKCIELGLSPVSLDDDSIDLDNDNDHHSITGSGRTSTVPGDSDTETDTDGDDGETESSDTDESKSRLPEHEAARCLISLSMTSPINSLTSSQQSLQNVSYSYMDQNLSSDSHHEEHGGNRRVITFASPKAEFNLSKHGQYYSNPNLHRNLRQNEVQNSQSDDPMPIDLTKPKDKINRSPPKLQQPQTQQLQQHQQRNIHPKFSETDTVKFMTSLVSIMDKIPPTTPILNNNNHPVQIDENILLHQYLTERALQDSKMKQSQMIKMVSSLTTTTTTLTSSTTSQSQGNYTNNITNNRNNNHLRTVTALSLPISSSISLPIDIIDRKIQQNNNTIIDGVNINYKNSLLMKKNNNQIIFQKNLNIDDDNNENSNNIISNEISIKLLTQSSTKLNKSLETGQISNKGGNVIFTRNETQKILEKPEINVYDNRIDTNTASGMDTLAEIAASSIKLEINPIITSSPSSSSSSSLSTILSDIKITNDNVKLIQLKNIPNTATDNAKSVASEYLKMTTNEGSKKQQKQRSKQDWEDIESGSDQEPIIDGSKIVTTSTTISTTSLTTAVTTTTTVSGGSTTDMIARTVVVGEDGFKNPTTDLPVGYSPARLTEDGRSVCTVCSKTFQKEYHLLLHYNIHYIERKFRCEPCGVSFRTKGHLQKHERSVQHHNKVSMSTTYGVATTTNPRPFKCLDCKVAFRIHGHLAKHLRSKSHVMKLECIGKLPFGMYAEIERCSFSLTDIDTTDCDNSLASLLLLAQTIHEKDPTKFGNWTPDNVVIINNKILPSSDIRHINNVSGVVGGGNGESGDSDDSEQILDDTNPILNENSSNSINTVGGINSGGIVVVNSGVIGGVGSIGGGGGDSAFSSDSSTGSIKRKIDAITGSLDPSLPDDILIHEKRLKITTSSDT